MRADLPEPTGIPRSYGPCSRVVALIQPVMHAVHEPIESLEHAQLLFVEGKISMDELRPYLLGELHLADAARAAPLMLHESEDAVTIRRFLKVPSLEPTPPCGHPVIALIDPYETFSNADTEELVDPSDERIDEDPQIKEEEPSSPSHPVTLAEAVQ